MAFIDPFVPIALRWAPVAACSIAGATIAWRSIRWFARRQRHCCTRCGHALQGGEWTTNVCPECGADRNAARGARSVAGIALGAAMQWPLASHALAFPAGEMALVIAMFGVVGCAYFVDQALQRGAAMKRRGWKARAALALSAIFLQLPWMLASYRFLRATYLEYLVSTWALPGQSVYGVMDTFPCASIAYAWMPDVWLRPTSHKGVHINIDDVRGWNSLTSVSGLFVVSLSATDLTIPPPSRAQFEQLARFDSLEWMSLPMIVMPDPDLESELASLRPGIKVSLTFADSQGTPEQAVIWISGSSLTFDEMCACRTAPNRTLVFPADRRFRGQ